MKKKLVASLITGVLLMVSAQALGSSVTLVGKKIQAEYIVTVYGKKLADPAIIIDGKSYAPLRAIGELAGYNVSVSRKTISLEEKSGSASSPASDKVTPEIMGPVPLSTPDPATSTAKSKIKAIDGKIDTVVDNILSTSALLKSDSNNTELKSKLEQYKADYTELLKQKDAELEN